jgi:hypothetical protein
VSYEHAPDLLGGLLTGTMQGRRDRPGTSRGRRSGA